MESDKKLSHKDFEPNKKFDLGITVLSEQEIIDFAKAFDPLDFHTNKDVAEKSIFRGIIASGPHVFNLVYRTKWIPLFGHTVICGLEMSSWKFLKPVYPGQKVNSTVVIKLSQLMAEKKYAIVKWGFEFKDEKGDMVQSLDMTISHKME